MAIKARYTNPAVNDTVILQLFTYNSNAPADFNSITKVEIYCLDPTEKTEHNPEGRRLVTTIDGGLVSHTAVGIYQISLPLTGPLFVIGHYIDVWHITVGTDNVNDTVSNSFEIYPDLWFSTPLPIVYDFSFSFHPNKIRKGSIKYLIIDIEPNVPKASDLARYYQQLAIVSPLQISIEQICGHCLPEETDLRLLLDAAPVELRDKCVGYYLLDTTEMEKGIYDVWFNLQMGETLNISEKLQLQIF